MAGGYRYLYNASLSSSSPLSLSLCSRESFASGSPPLFFSHLFDTCARYDITVRNSLTRRYQGTLLSRVVIMRAAPPPRFTHARTLPHAERPSLLVACQDPLRGHLNGVGVCVWGSLKAGKKMTARKIDVAGRRNHQAVIWA